MRSDGAAHGRPPKSVGGGGKELLNVVLADNRELMQGREANQHVGADGRRNRSKGSTAVGRNHPGEAAPGQWLAATLAASKQSGQLSHA